MGNDSPSKYRRMGRNAYVSGGDPLEYCNIDKNSWNFQYTYEHFLEGWNEEKAVELKNSIDDYEISATFSDGSEEFIGSVCLPENLSFEDMPVELEINGHTYIIEGHIL